MKAKIHVYLKDSINTDEIIPARYLNTDDEKELAKHAMEDIDKDFVKKVKLGDAIIAGEDFGCGSSREHAVWALRGAGVQAVIAKSFARIFYPPTLPYTIIFGPLSYSPYDNSTQKGISPSLILKCEQREFKNIIEEQIITCIIKKNIPGWNNTVINHIEVNYGSDSNNFWKNLDKGDKIDFNIKNENNYTITAFYHGGNIKVDLFNKIDFLSIDDYSELRYKRMGIISAFVIFSMSILISFVKNISEMKRDNSILPEPNRNNS